VFGRGYTLARMIEPTSPLQYLIPFVLCFIAGGVNALAGGGTAISFPGFLFIGLNPIVANATNNTALTPGAFAGAFAYRENLRPQLKTFFILLTPTVIGSLLGALIVAHSSADVFRRIVPFLVLGATLLFAFRAKVVALLTRVAGSAAAGHEGHITPLGYTLGCALQFVIALYGGYFGAGIGILMLSSLSIMGMKDMHRMNALKTALATCINGTAIVFFALDGLIHWPLALVSAVGASMGGYILARLAKHIPQSAIRAFVVIFGSVAALWLFLRAFGILGF